MRNKFIRNSLMLACGTLTLTNTHGMNEEDRDIQVGMKPAISSQIFVKDQWQVNETNEKVIQNKSIMNISEVLEDFLENLKGNTIAVWDWDDSVSPWDDILRTGLQKFEPRESGENGTLAVIKAFQDRGIKNMVLTGRLSGHPLDEKREIFEATVQNMLELVGLEKWTQHGPFKNTDTLELKIPDVKNRSCGKGSKERSLYLLAKNHFVFAGGNQVKGKVLQLLIDMDVFINTPDNIIFIDNERKNTIEIEESFKNSSHNLYIYYYPGPKERLGIERK